MTVRERLVNAILRLALRLIARIDARDLKRLPRRGPGILMSNHTTNLEGPAYYLFVQPRRTTALGKQELWTRWHTRFLMNLWKVIPVSRGQVDRKALRAAFSALDAGMYLGIAPEGTRSRTGQLQEGHPGIALVATRRQIPVYPVVHWGMLNLGRSLKRLRRARVTIRVGRPFCVRLPKGLRVGPAVLREITTEMMREMARALPVELRGAYAELPESPPRYLEYLDQLLNSRRDDET